METRSQEKLLSLKQVAVFAKLPETTIRTWNRKDPIPDPIVKGLRVFYSQEVVAKWLEHREIKKSATRNNALLLGKRVIALYEKDKEKYLSIMTLLDQDS